MLHCLTCLPYVCTFCAILSTLLLYFLTNLHFKTCIHTTLTPLTGHCARGHIPRWYHGDAWLLACTRDGVTRWELHLFVVFVIRSGWEGQVCMRKGRGGAWVGSDPKTGHAHTMPGIYLSLRCDSHTHQLLYWLLIVLEIWKQTNKLQCQRQIDCQLHTKLSFVCNWRKPTRPKNSAINLVIDSATHLLMINSPSSNKRSIMCLYDIQFCNVPRWMHALCTGGTALDVVSDRLIIVACSQNSKGNHHTLQKHLVNLALGANNVQHVWVILIH